MVFGKLLKKNKDIKEKKDVIEYGNLDEKQVNKTLDLIRAAQECEANFDVHFELSVGNFCVDALELNSIKSVKKTKTHDASIIINHSDMIMSNEVVIPLKYILNISVEIYYCCSNNDDNQDVGEVNEH